VLAPQSGTVLDLRYHTRGGVIEPGGEILDLVPDDDRMVVEARVSPTDIDVVHTGLPAEVVLPAYKAARRRAWTAVCCRSRPTR
jgi:multidrug efflux pump subunit AcrA (membrane-fusion protein)